MSSTDVQLILRQLGSGINHNENGTRPVGNDKTQFASMLKAARSGEVRSGLAVTASPQFQFELGTEKMSTLSGIADVAQAYGLKRVLISDGPIEYTLDVELREVASVEPENSGGFTTGIDSFIKLSETGFELNGADKAGDILLHNLGN